VLKSFFEHEVTTPMSPGSGGMVLSRKKVALHQTTQNVAIPRVASPGRAPDAKAKPVAVSPSAPVRGSKGLRLCIRPRWSFLF
jgi:hypothetical protein